MAPTKTRKKARPIPKKRAKHYSYNASVNEAPEVIEDEVVDIEGNIPAEENEPIGPLGENDERISVVFEE